MTQRIRQYPDELREQAETDMLTIHPPIPCPACRRADQAGLAPSEQHPDCITQEPQS